MQYTAIFHGCKNSNFQMKICDSFLIFAQNTEAVLTSTHDLCFRAKISKNAYPCKPKFYYIKWGVRGCTLHGHVFMMRTTTNCTRAHCLSGFSIRKTRTDNFIVFASSVCSLSLLLQQHLDMSLINSVDIRKKVLEKSHDMKSLR